MKELFSPLVCFSVTIPSLMICGLFPDCIANILRSLLSLVILVCLILFSFKTLKKGIVSLNLFFYGISTAFATIFFLVQTLNSTYLESLLLIICPFFILFFIVSILVILVIAIFQTSNIISKILFASEFLLTLFWVAALIKQGHNIQNTLNIFLISFSILLAMISFSVKYAR